MSLEIKSIEKKVIVINCLASKRIRILKAITTDSIFKTCIDYLNRKAFCNIRCGRESELVWKTALLDKDEQTESMEKWFKVREMLRRVCRARMRM